MALDLKGADRYNPNMLPQLESFVKEPGSYSLPASLALLRTYVTQPDKANIKLLSDLLVKAMMQLPSSDFATVLHLIPERLQEDADIASLIALMQHLDAARYQSFWLACDACRSANLGKVPGFTEAVRKHILRSVKATFQKVTRSTLAEYLRMDGAALDELVEEKVKDEGWKVAKGPSGNTIYILPKMSSSLSSEQTTPSSAFRFEQLAPLLASH